MEHDVVGRHVLPFLSARDRETLRVISRRWYFTCTWLQDSTAFSLSKKSPLNLQSPRFQHVWLGFLKARCNDVLIELMAQLPPPSLKETYELKAGLCESTNTGIRPSFENASARSGYVAAKMNRCGNLPNVLLTREIADVRRDLFGYSSRSSKCLQLALYGGGPGYDGAGLALLLEYLRADDIHLRVNVYDNEPGWEAAVTGMSSGLEKCCSSKVIWHFKPCDITLSIRDGVNQNVGTDADTTDLFIFSFVCVENLRLLERSNFIFLRELFLRCRVGSYFIFMDSTHRLWPLLWKLADETGNFRVWTPHAKGCHYALVLQKLGDGSKPRELPFFEAAIARLAVFEKHHMSQMQRLKLS
ncbi:hypothetical protein ATCC90586_005179 [Pythium insidiosum]|nr:hypothetical protein ATCC90586_005179 [Pythium insidiosum]